MNDDTDDEYLAYPRLTDEEWELLKRCEDIRPFVDRILDGRMRTAYDIGWGQGVVDTTRKWGPKGQDMQAQSRRLLWNVMTEQTEPPLYGEGSQ